MEQQTMFEKLCSFENLLQAYKKARRGKRMHDDVAKFDFYLEYHLIQLRDQLQNQTYRPEKYRRFVLRDPKERYISAAIFRDRVVHHAVCNIIEPIFERTFIKDSYANRAGKGIHHALDRVTYFARRFPYVLRCDVRQFFPSIDLQILEHELWRRLPDSKVMWLCRQILEGGSQELTDQYQLILYPGDVKSIAEQRPRGLPIGNQTSQFWANCYLDALDHFVKDKLGCHAYVRYVDDFVLMSNKKAELHQWRQAIIAFLASQLRLSIHESESAITPVAVGIPFLGFTVFPDHRRLRRRNGVHFAQKLQRLRKDFALGIKTQEECKAHIQGWIAHVSHGDTWRLRESIFKSGFTKAVAEAQI